MHDNLAASGFITGEVLVIEDGRTFKHIATNSMGEPLMATPALSDGVMYVRSAESLFAVGNGYLGMRGNVEEGRESHTQGTFINGFHETWKINHAEEAFGFARVGQTIVNAPDVKVIRLYVDDEPLLLPVADLIDYERSLDFRTGVLCREIVWRTPAGKRVRIKSQRMVSFTQRHLAVMTFEVTMLDAAAPVTLSSQILNRQDGGDEYHVRSAAMGEGTDPRKAERFGRRVLIPELQDAGDDDARVMLGYRTAESGMTIAVATDHSIESRDPVQRTVQVTDDMAKVVYQIDAQPGRTIRLTKVAAYHTSRGVPAAGHGCTSARNWSRDGARSATIRTISS
mgnify:CR=1 FL=1